MPKSFDVDRPFPEDDDTGRSIPPPSSREAEETALSIRFSIRQKAPSERMVALASVVSGQNKRRGDSEPPEQEGGDEGAGLDPNLEYGDLWCDLYALLGNFRARIKR